MGITNNVRLYSRGARYIDCHHLPRCQPNILRHGLSSDEAEESRGKEKRLEIAQID